MYKVKHTKENVSSVTNIFFFIFVENAPMQYDTFVKPHFFFFLFDDAYKM